MKDPIKRRFQESLHALRQINHIGNNADRYSQYNCCPKKAEKPQDRSIECRQTTLSGTLGHARLHHEIDHYYGSCSIARMGGMGKCIYCREWMSCFCGWQAGRRQERWHECF